MGPFCHTSHTFNTKLYHTCHTSIDDGGKRVKFDAVPGDDLSKSAMPAVPSEDAEGRGTQIPRLTIDGLQMCRCSAKGRGSRGGVTMACVVVAIEVGIAPTHDQRQGIVGQPPKSSTPAREAGVGHPIQGFVEIERGPSAAQFLRHISVRSSFKSATPLGAISANSMESS